MNEEEHRRRVALVECDNQDTDEEHIDPILEKEMRMEMFMRDEADAVLNFKRDAEKYIYETSDPDLCKNLDLRSIWDLLDTLTPKI
jgi:hypothetical protein